ncbi:RNA recognition motif domain-containing protein [Candidatus Venteria ishoeyi]|uniref:RNA recognition motif. (A.k.a. RRM, RBD, or RNP domain) n=1 Tax=Candidatus Venteria ishoeyi TaxID=1899563 RepID=A0A1H6FBA3_9GAMM|nr:RNA-binding protein [Candidatus Venteria ishoeyi]MDM8547301.1 RNA-binding protein [Candidatus Venteria ishoeyi]SEH07367.1 Uncharacterised protein [Candidatus Venteria ishoeyi]
MHLMLYNLPGNTNAQELQSFLTSYCAVTSIKLIGDDKQTDTVIGFVDTHESPACLQVIADRLQHKMWKGQHLFAYIPLFFQ